MNGLSQCPLSIAPLHPVGVRLSFAAEVRVKVVESLLDASCVQLYFTYTLAAAGPDLLIEHFLLGPKYP